MKILVLMSAGIVFLYISFIPLTAPAQLNDLLKGLGNLAGDESSRTAEKSEASGTSGISGTGLSQTDIIGGLKQALEVGTGNAVTDVSQTDGYFGNPDIRIPLPGSIEKVQSLLQLAGYDSQVDAFLKSMNRAAERAAPEAKAVFWDAIKQMTFDDAKEILQGRDNEATLYFQEKTSGTLHQKFEPIIQSSMSEVGVTSYYQNLTSNVTNIPLLDESALDLDSYVTDKALDGLFYMVGQEEMKIRRNPTARATDLLKKVFGNR